MNPAARPSRSGRRRVTSAYLARRRRRRFDDAPPPNPQRVDLPPWPIRQRRRAGSSCMWPTASGRRIRRGWASTRESGLRTSTGRSSRTTPSSKSGRLRFRERRSLAGMDEPSSEEREPFIERGEAFCDRCGLRIQPGSAWRWGHIEDGLDVVDHEDRALVAAGRPVPKRPPSPHSRDRNGYVEEGEHGAFCRDGQYWVVIRSPRAACHRLVIERSRTGEYRPS